MVSGGGARTHRPKGRDAGKPRRNIWVLSLCPRSPCPSAFLPLPHTLRAEECTVGARRPVVTIIVCSVRRMSLEPTAPRPAPAFTADEERPITGRPFLVPLYVPHFTARSRTSAIRCCPNGRRAYRM